jgi:DNA polymerase alpha-associated DNA helicase A
MGEDGGEKESKMNIGEADLVISIYKKLLSYGVNSRYIAILTPYSKQVATIKSLVGDKNLPLVDVSTVDGIQGREK